MVSVVPSHTVYNPLCCAKDNGCMKISPTYARRWPFMKTVVCREVERKWECMKLRKGRWKGEVERIKQPDHKAMSYKDLTEWDSKSN